MPAPYGSAATNAGRIASPPTTSVRPSSSTTAPSSPGPAYQSPPPNTSATRPIALFATHPGQLSEPVGQGDEVHVVDVLQAISPWFPGVGG